MTPLDKKKQTAGQYSNAVIDGGISGAALGGILAGRRSVIKGAVAGAAASVAGRRLLHKKVATLQDKGKEFKAEAVGSLPGAIPLGIAAAGILNHKSLNKIAKRAGESFRDFKTKPRVGKTSPMKSSDYRDIVQEPKPIAGLLKRFSEREALDSIINLKAVDLGYTYPTYPYDSPSSQTKKRYPSLYIDDRENEIDLPLNGTAKVKFKMVSKTTRQDEDGKKKHSASIEIQSIDPVEEEIEAQPGAAKPLKLLKSELRDIIELGARRKKIGPRKQGVQMPIMDSVPGDCPGATSYFSERDELAAILQFGNDPRQRNRLGEFSDDTGINHQAIHATYRQGLAEGAVGGALAVKGTQALSKVLKKVRK